MTEVLDTPATPLTPCRVVTVAPYPVEECDAALLAAAIDGVFPAKNFATRCSGAAIEEALRMALFNGHIHIADLLQPVTALFRQGNIPEVPVETYNQWISACLENADAVEWLLDRGASLSEEIIAENIRAIRLLPQLKRFDPAVIPLLDSQPRVRDEVMKALETAVNLDGCTDLKDELFSRLMAVLADPNEEYAIRLKAARIMGRIPNATTILSLLGHGDVTCDALVIYCVGLMQDPKAIPALVKSLNGPLVLAAIEALGNCGKDVLDGVDELIPFAESDDESIREAVCVALGKRGRAQHAQVVAALLEDNSADIQKAAEDALGLILSRE